MPNKARPSRADVLAAAGKTVADVIAPGLEIVFCGINPGLYTAAVGHHFARPGNRFWPTLYAAGFTPRLLDPSEERLLLDYGHGITNLVARATAGADELTRDELRQGGVVLAEKMAKYQPKCLAILGLSAYRSAFARPKAETGLQHDAIGGAQVWVLPNPSGLNAHYQLADLVDLFRQLRLSIHTNSPAARPADGR